MGELAEGELLTSELPMGELVSCGLPEFELAVSTERDAAAGAAITVELAPTLPKLNVEARSSTAMAADKRCSAKELFRRCPVNKGDTVSGDFSGGETLVRRPELALDMWSSDGSAVAVSPSFSSLASGGELFRELLSCLGAAGKE